MAKNVKINSRQYKHRGRIEGNDELGACTGRFSGDCEKQVKMDNCGHRSDFNITKTWTGPAG